MNYDEMKNKLEQMLSIKRYLHSLRVADEAVAIAKHYGIDEQKAYLAGLLHDCAKNINTMQSINILEKNGVSLTECEKMSSGLLHAPLGAIIAAKEFLVDDSEVLNAISCHTTGKANMSELDKVIYLADLIEPGRNYVEIDSLREAVYDNLNNGMFAGLDYSIKYVLLKKSVLHPNTVEAWNYIRINNEEDLNIERRC